MEKTAVVANTLNLVTLRTCVTGSDSVHTAGMTSRLNTAEPRMVPEPIVRAVLPSCVMVLK